MKCNNCAIDVSPGYTKALNENACPACGENIMTAPLFQEFGSVKESLSGSEVSEADLVKVAALISGKYRLMPRDAVQQRGQNRFNNKSVTRLANDQVVNEDRDADLAGLPPDVQAREKALRDAEDEKVASEWGLAEGELSTSVNLTGQSKISDITQEPVSQEVAELASMFGAPGGEVSAESAFASSGPSQQDAFEAQRLAKLATLKANPSYQAVRRADG